MRFSRNSARLQLNFNAFAQNLFTETMDNLFLRFKLKKSESTQHAVFFSFFSSFDSAICLFNSIGFPVFGLPSSFAKCCCVCMFLFTRSWSLSLFLVHNTFSSCESSFVRPQYNQMQCVLSMWSVISSKWQRQSRAWACLVNKWDAVLWLFASVFNGLTNT